MPPKKQDKKDIGKSGTLGENDFSDIAQLPILNDFVFMTFYSFKYQQNKKMMEQSLTAEFDLTSLGQADPETAELSKRNRVISQTEILDRARAAGYLTDAELASLATVDPVKLQQVFARCTNEILVSIQLPLRREKLDLKADFEAKISQATDSDKQSFKKKMSEVELFVWLKDFPKTASDFKEMRRSALQHMPEVDLSIHAGIMIEEQFKIDYDEDDVPSNNGREVSAENQAEEEIEAARKLKEEFTKEERGNSFRDLMYINKYAQNCPTQSQMRLFVPHRIKFHGADPPPQMPEPVVIEAPVVDIKGKPGKVVEPVAPVEVQKTPEQMAVEKMFLKFMKGLRKDIDKMASDVTEYRQISMGPDAIKIVPFWPKKFSEAEIQAQKAKEEAARLLAEQEAAEAAQALAAASSKAPEKGKKAAQVASPQVEKPSSRSGSRAETPLSKLGRPSNLLLLSQDDGPKDWNFIHFQRVVSEMNTESTSVGSILAAMIYQIEKANQVVDSEQPLPQKDLGSELDDMFIKLAMEQAVIETDFKHKFEVEKINTKGAINEQSSPYQGLINADNGIQIRRGQYTFMNGKDQSEYEEHTLDRLELPGINDRFKMPKTATKQPAQRSTEICSILRNCQGIPTNQAKRMLLLKEFQDLLKENNPEREYNFQDRNYQEEYDPSTFRQLLTHALRSNPDVNTAYFDKEDALLLALNFKNPQGRLLRRQWTAQLKGMPSFQDWRKIKDEVDMPADFINIPTNNLGVCRQNVKFCYPYDNSVIRSQKNFVGGRRFGTSVIVKDNLIFGIKESQSELDSKVADDDTILNNEAKKQTDRRCEFWLEFENGVRMHAEMLDKKAATKEMIPPTAGPTQSKSPQRQVILVEGEPGHKSSIRDVRESRDSDAQKPLLKKLTKQSSQISQIEAKIEPESQPTAVEPVKIDDYQPNQGASLTFTFKEGLTVQILPNGNVQQTILRNTKMPQKQGVIITDQNEDSQESMRTITREGCIIKELKDGNQVIYLSDGTITTTDHRRGIWKTINHRGIVRERNVRNNQCEDLKIRLESNQKVDPETGAIVNIREDGFLRIEYVDRSSLLVFPDHTKLLITRTGADEEESKTVTKIFTKEGYSPVKITYDPIKARSGTLIGLGGADALMGRDGIMERSNGGLVSEVFLPDRSIVQTYFEKQELPGYNRCSKSLIHLVKRDDYSRVKVRQDGEVVIITANARAYLNEIGKQETFGTKDFDFFFELFGLANERRTGVYTCNLDKGRIWTKDEEGNHFIVYANGDSTEKLSVSFNLDQMIEGIDNKEPRSPRVKDGEFIEEECKFLPPPKTVGDPRLFLVKQNSVIEFSNKKQLEYVLRCFEMDKEVQKTHNAVTFNNEPAVQHLFMRQQKAFNAENPSTLASVDYPKMPQALEMVNQTVSIRSEPEKSQYLRKKILSFKESNEDDIQSFYHALTMDDSLQEKQRMEADRLRVKTRNLETLKNQTRLWLRIAKSRGVDVKSLLDEEYNPVKQLDLDTKREALFKSLDEHYQASSEGL